MKKKYLLAGLGVGVMALLAASVAYAAGNNYEAWRSVIGNNGGRAASAVTEQNFDRFTKMHQLMAEGNYIEAQKIRTELGLGQGRGKGGAGGCGMKNSASGQNGGCRMNNGGTGKSANFIDADKNGICDHAEQAVK